MFFIFSYADEIINLSNNKSSSLAHKTQWVPPMHIGINRIKTFCSFACVKFVTRKQISLIIGQQRFRYSLCRVADIFFDRHHHFTTDMRLEFFSFFLSLVLTPFELLYLLAGNERVYNFVYFDTHNTHKNTIQNLFDPKKVKNFYKYSRWWFMMFGSTMVQCSQPNNSDNNNERSSTHTHTHSRAHTHTYKWEKRKEERNTTKMI